MTRCVGGDGSKVPIHPSIFTIDYSMTIDSTYTRYGYVLSIRLRETQRRCDDVVGAADSELPRTRRTHARTLLSRARLPVPMGCRRDDVRRCDRRGETLCGRSPFRDGRADTDTCAVVRCRRGPAEAGRQIRFDCGHGCTSHGWSRRASDRRYPEVSIART